MFTGIITDIGTIDSITRLNEGVHLRISCNYDPQTIDIGASIACSGICLSVVARSQQGDNRRWFEVEAWEEALRLTTLGDWRIGDQINLERSLKLGDEMGGHLVSGHVDGRAQIVGVRDEGEARRFHVRIDQALAPFIAPKGSVCLDGTSLTVNQVNDCIFDVLIIRHTLEVTTWGRLAQGDWLNIEIDQMARYAARLSAYPIN